MLAPRLLTSLTFIAALAIPGAALAQDPGPHHVRAGILLGAAEEETKLFFDVLTAKVIDVELGKTTLAEVKKLVADAKSASFRASQLKDDAKSDAVFGKLDEALKKVEESVKKLEADYKTETAGLKIDEENPDIAPQAGTEGKEKEQKQPDWEGLKNTSGQLFKDIQDARAAHAAAGKTLKLPALKPVPPPKAKK
ncbi:MAG: hypothetical protein U1E65_36100 [Myxococcota bacterium]